jgi:sec-independent protein translocase protein TatB
MFNFSWSEIALIVVVALIAIGPKDLPAALKTVAAVIKKTRGMAAEFQTHVNELMREADLEDVRKHIDEIRNFDIKGTVERTLDPDQSLRKTFTDDPFKAADAAAAGAAGGYVSPGGGGAADAASDAAPDGETTVLERPEAMAEEAPIGEEMEAAEQAPAFVPPAVAAATMRPPAFVPPDLLTRRS